MDTIRIHAADTEAEAKDRHEQIIKRLEELGPGHVKILMSSGGLPTVWNPIIAAWLKDK